MNEIDNSSDDEEILDFEDDIEKKIEINREKLEENPEENLKAILFKDVKEKNISEALIKKAIEVYKIFNLEEKSSGINIIQSIISEVCNSSKFNFNQRIIDFFDFILSIPNLKYTYLRDAIKIKKKDSKIDNNNDIIFLWKQFIVEEQLKEENIYISRQMKDCLKLLLEHNFNLNEINYIFLLFKKVITNDISTQYDIIYSLISTLILYPNFLKENDIEKRRKTEEELKEFIENYIIKVNDKYVFNEKKNTALDFYLKISSDKKYNDSRELEKKEIFMYLKINNPDISEELINTIDEELESILWVKENIIFQKYEKLDFQNWAKIGLQEIKIKNPNKIKTTILGMISLAIYKVRGYHLRIMQIIAILLFIHKESKYGLIEEIATGEGKSCIISSLSIFYALNGHKVDIISSSYTLAQRDSEEFKELYSYFNLTTGYPSNSRSGPYKTDILYGTFLEFEGDYLREITSNQKIRNNRPFDVIIIDEVDNLFIDNILGSTRLTNSSLGFKFLAPIYLTIYCYIELFDYIFLLFFKVCLDNMENDEKKRKFEKIINNPNERKKEMIKIFQGNFEYILKNKKNVDKNNNENNNQINPENLEKANDEFFEFLDNLSKFLECPEFLKSFVETESQYWFDTAYQAKNLMEIDRDYVEIIDRSGNRNIAPVDRTNTGEIEINTVYSNGLHQMLEIKHKLRFKDETLVHTFLSHITFFQKYKKKEFLFFGLTGTIGNEETQKVYGNEYFNSKLLFIPQYKKKRFVELPPLLVSFNEHLLIICKDIIINFNKGRKILVICSSIKEAKIIEDELKYRIKPEQLNIDNVSKINEGYKNSIILYTRSDTEKANIKQKNKRIILSTNLGGRGTDIQTTEEDEKNGGLHVILTYMPKNYRVLKQAFGRTSREGKKGTAQIILRNTGYKSYSDVTKEMNINEKNEISYIQKQLRILLFKDRLFENFSKLIKNVDFNGYLIEDINERWANFLRINVTLNDGDLKINEIETKFEMFKKQIISMLNENETYRQFENPFYRMKEGLRLYRNYEYELINYYNFNPKINKFYFAQPYILAIIIISNPHLYNEKNFQKIIEYFDESIKRIKLLIEENLNPILESFQQWQDILNNFDTMFKAQGNISSSIINTDKPFSDKSYISSDLFKQYNNIKMICNKIINRIEENKKFMRIFTKEYKKDDTCKILITEEDLEDGLSLNEEQLKEKPFFSDAVFNKIFKFSIKRKKRYLNSFLWLLLLVGIIIFIAGYISGILAGVVAFAIIAYYTIDIKKAYKKGVEIGTNSLFGNIFFIILKSIKKNKNKIHMKREAVVQKLHKDEDLIRSNKNILFENIIYSVENHFEKIKNSLSTDLINFLIFIDYYYSVDTWSEKIKKIFSDKFDDIYKKGFTENNFFNTAITNDTFEIHLNNYNNLFDKYLDACITEIYNLGNYKKYNKKDGLNCLEHLIIDLNPEKINEDIANKIVQKILKYNLISEIGIIDKKLFKDCFKDENGEKYEQKIKIHINNKIINVNSIKKITNLDVFKIDGFQIPLVDSSFLDLSNLYQIKHYNVQQQLERDFTLYIINNLKQIIIYLLHMDPIILQNFYSVLLNFIKTMIKNLLQEKIFSKYNTSSFENVIGSELTEEERVEFRKMIKEATDNAEKLLKK